MTSYIVRRINAVIADMDTPQCSCLDCTGAACACTETSLCLFHQVEEHFAQALQEALTDHECYCDWDSQCPVCYAEEQRLIAANSATTYNAFYYTHGTESDDDLPW